MEPLQLAIILEHYTPESDPFSSYVAGWNRAIQYVKGDPARLPLPVNVIFHDPATIVYWSDGTKTVVKCQHGDVFNPEVGLTTAMLKRYMGNDNTFKRVINKWLKHTGEYKPPVPMESATVHEAECEIPESEIPTGLPLPTEAGIYGINMTHPPQASPFYMSE